MLHSPFIYSLPDAGSPVCLKQRRNKQDGIEINNIWFAPVLFDSGMIYFIFRKISFFAPDILLSVWRDHRSNLYSHRTILDGVFFSG